MYTFGEVIAFWDRFNYQLCFYIDRSVVRERGAIYTRLGQVQSLPSDKIQT